MSDLFPTRSGEAQGHGAERTMAEKVDASGFRTVIRNNPDGSVTMLRTRGGALHYSTTPAPKTSEPVPIENLRGFVAQKTDAGSGVCFDPTQWVVTSGMYAEPKIIDRKFSPVIKTYYVSELTTDNNAIAAGTTQWQDVWTLTSGSLRINNIAPTFLGSYTLPTFSGIPFFIPINGTYGTLAENAGQVKRIFVVGREKVEAVTDGTMVEAPAVELCSKVARNNHRAMTCGPAIDRAENKAMLSQLFYTGSFWDSIDSGWAMGITEVAMLLTPPYLNQVDSYPAVTQASAVPQIQPTFSGVSDTPIEFPSANLGIYGVAEPGPSGPNGGFGTGGAWANVNIPFRGLVYGVPDAGFKHISQSGNHWLGSVFSTENVSGVDISLTASNDLKKLNNAVYLKYNDFYHVNFADKQFTPPGMSNSLTNAGGSYNGTTGVTTWVLDDPYYQSQLNINPINRAYFYFPSQNVTGTSFFPSQEQSATFNVIAGDIPLVFGSFTRNYIEGFDRAPFAKSPDHYQQYLDNPYGLVGETSGFGTFCRAHLEVNFGGNSLYQAAAYSAVLARQAEYTGRIAYSSAEDGGMQINPWGSSEIVVPPTTTMLLNWATRDYLLYDDAEQVYVYVLGTFTATAPNALLTVELVIKTRHAESRKTLYQTTFWYDEMLPTQELQSGVQYVPLPRLSVFFTPKYRHQGDFRGAAYTTTTEEAPDGEVAGATPVCLMNFILTLQMFDYIGTQEQQDNLQKGVDEQFVPCNLLEMLYAYVFSSDYGQNDYSRYPVTYRNNFNKLYAELFNVQHAIAFKDGAFVDWAASIAGHNPSTTTGIYRT